MTATIRLLLALLLTACAADSGDAPDEPSPPIVQAAEGVPYCTDDAQCEAGQRCDQAADACVGAVHEHPCQDTATDPYNCGACGALCPWGDSVAIGCTDGVCWRVGTVGDG